MAGTRQPVFASGRGRGERRPWRLLLALALALGPAAALGQEDAPEEGLVAEDLDTLMAIPLPGEAAVAPEPVDRDAVDRLMGRTIVRVTTSDSAPGFDPVQDANIPLGLELSRALVRKAVYRLWETGRYRDVTIRVRPVQAHEVELVVGVEPMLRVGRIRIKGNSALDDEDVAKAMGYTPGQTILPDPEVLRGLKGKLLAVYASKGYREARASLSIVTTEDPGTVDLVGEITEGEPERYDVIEIPGLPESVNSEAVLKKGTVRDHALIDGATGKLRTLLAKAGYLDAEILPFEERRIDRYRMALRIPLKVKFPTEFHIEGNRHFLATHLLEIVDGEGAMGTTPESVSRRLRSLKKYYREHGFFFVDIEVLRRCFARRDTARIMRIDGQCRPGTARQEIIIIVREGPDVEVDEILSLGNRWFTDEDIQEELFAFVAEKNAPKSVFQPVAPATLDELGISDKRPDGNGSTRGIDAPRTQRARVYVPEQYAQAMAHLVGVYQEQGFLSAAVRDTCLIKSRRAITRNGERFVPLVISRDSEGGEEPGHKDLAPCVYVNGERDRLLVVIHVDEGVQTTVQEIAFDGNQVLSSMALQEITGISIAAPYNEYRLREASRRVAERYRSLGYMFVDVTWEKRFSEDMHRAKVIYTIQEGPKVRVGQIRIEGAETTSKRLIRERLTLGTGSLITPDELEKSQVRLMELGIFNGATVQMASPEVPSKTKNLKIQVSEAKPQYLEFRWGIASVEGLRAGLEYGFNNIGGYALNTRFRARANYRLFFVGNPEFEERYERMSLVDQLEHHVLVGIGSPHLPGTYGLLGWGVDVVKERINKPGFSADRLTTFLKLNIPVALGAKYPHGFLLETRTGFEYNIEILQGLSNDPFLIKYLRLPQGESAFYVVGLAVSLDLRDSPFNPTEGFFLSIGGDWVKSVPVVPIKRESNLIRSNLTASGYVKVFDTDLVVALSFSVGYIFHLKDGSITWPDRYFYVGGIDTLRGFPEDSLMPEDLYNRWKAHLHFYGEDIDKLLNTTGGEATLVTRAELRYPLAKGFYGAGFGELGNVWRKQSRMHPVTLRPLKVHLRPVAGLGIRYLTPLGPISFDLGINLKRRPREDLLSWYLSIGTAF